MASIDEIIKDMSIADRNEYFLRIQLERVCNERDDLKNQIKALTAINKGLTHSLQECLTEADARKSLG